MKGQDIKTILVIDDETSIREMLELAVKKWNFKIKTASTLKEGIAAVERGKVDLILSDIKLPDGNGIEVLNRAISIPGSPPVILMTAFGDTDAAVQAVKMGAFYYVTKPFKLEELKILIDRALSETNLKKENAVLKEDVKKEFSAKSMIGKSKIMRELFDLIDRISKTKTNILITGESGTGKELVARAIHYGGPLKNKPFVAVNCGAIPENLIESELFGHKRGSFTGAVSDKDGLFVVADGGTIFLDEVGELPMSMQVKLLRVLQDRTIRPVGSNDNIKIDVRVISATNRNLEEAIVKSTFREDLYYRLNVINIKTAALRERKEDIPDLIEHFLRKYSLGMGKQIETVSGSAMKALLDYDFPGNVRELENTMERAVALEGTNEVQIESLPLAIQKDHGDVKPPKSQPKVKEVKEAHSDDVAMVFPVDLEAIVGDLERRYITAALERSGHQKKKAAELLGITFRSLRYRIDKYGIVDKEGDVGET